MANEANLTKLVDKMQKTETKKSYSVAMSPSVMEALRAFCDKRGIKYSPVIEECIKSFLDQAKK